MRNKSQYEQIAEIYNREQGTHIVLREDENGSMTPVIELDTQEVVFNPRFQTLLTLFIASANAFASTIALFMLLSSSAASQAPPAFESSL